MQRSSAIDGVLRMVWPLVRPPSLSSSIATPVAASTAARGVPVAKATAHTALLNGVMQSIPSAAMLAARRLPSSSFDSGPPPRFNQHQQQEQVTGSAGEPSTLMPTWIKHIPVDDAPRNQHLPRLLSMDVGDRIVGMAISDPHNRISIPITAMHRKLRSDEWRPHSANFRASPTHGSSKKQSPGDNKKHMSPTGYRPWVDVTVNELAVPFGQLLRQYQIAAVIVGLPLTMETAQEDAQTLKTRLFIKQLWQAMRPHYTPTSSSQTLASSSSLSPSQPQLPAVIWWDERLSTQEAKMELRERGIHGSVKQKEMVDSICARNMMQEVMEYADELINRRT